MSEYDFSDIISCYVRVARKKNYSQEDIRYVVDTFCKCVNNGAMKSLSDHRYRDRAVNLLLSCHELMRIMNFMD